MSAAWRSHLVAADGRENLRKHAGVLDRGVGLRAEDHLALAVLGVLPGHDVRELGDVALQALHRTRVGVGVLRRGEGEGRGALAQARVRAGGRGGWW